MDALVSFPVYSIAAAFTHNQSKLKPSSSPLTLFRGEFWLTEKADFHQLHAGCTLQAQYDAIWSQTRPNVFSAWSLASHLSWLALHTGTRIVFRIT